MSGPLRSLVIDLTPLKESVAFRRVFIARVISLIGIGMLLVSVPVQMYDLTRSSAHVGAATAVTGITTFVGMLVGGTLADRFDRRRLILAGRSGAALAFAGLAANGFGAFGESLQVPILYGLAGFDGLIGSLSTSALMAAIPTLIPRRLMMSVGALTTLSVRIGTAISPGIAGFVIAGAGVEWAYVAATVLATCTVLVLTGLPTLPPSAPVLDGSEDSDKHTAPVQAQHPAAPADPADRKSADPTSPTEDVPTSVWTFLLRERTVGSAMAVGVLAMLGAGVVALLPALTDVSFGGDDRATGLLYAAVATGAMIAALTSGWLADVTRPGRLLLFTLLGGFALMALFGLSPTLWIAIALLIAVGFLETIQEVLRYALIQQHTPGPLLGRVNGIWMSQEVGGITVGALVAGGLGTILVAPDAIVVYGAIMSVFAVIALVGFGTLRRVRAVAAPVHDTTSHAPDTSDNPV